MTATRRRTPQAVARLFLHDLLCQSESCDADDHAHRTLTDFGRDAVRAWKAGDDLAPVIHAKTCLGCPSKLMHELRMQEFAELLERQLAER